MKRTLEVKKVYFGVELKCLEFCHMLRDFGMIFTTTPTNSNLVEFFTYLRTVSRSVPLNESMTKQKRLKGSFTHQSQVHRQHKLSFENW
jgi:hypothetical protein